jgi:hypothetical protein
LILRHRVVRYLRESLPGFHQEVLDSNDGALTILEGFWQSERYFGSLRDVLCEEFTPRPGIVQHCELLSELESTQSVCVHVRRGDYLRKSGAHLGFVGKKYYYKAISAMAHGLNEPQFFVFSDDIEWCVKNLSIQAPHTFVREDGLSGSSASTLHLMSRCSHFVIGNSTFAWWAAWLGSSLGKRVIAPAGWFAAERGAPQSGATEHLHSSRDLVPEGWIRQ